MLAALVISIVASAAIAWTDGAAFVAPPGSALRERRSVRWLVIGTFALVTLPPQVLLLGGVKLPADLATLGIAGGLSFPPGFSAEPWWIVWVITTVVAALVGVRVWDAGKPGWRGSSNAFDSSATGRARALLLVADTLEDVADALARTGLAPKEVEALAPELRGLGRRLRDSMPPEPSGVYRSLAAKMGPGLAGPTTRLLVEGARGAA